MRVETSKGTLFLSFNHVKPVCVGDVETHKCTMSNHGDAGTYCLIKDENYTIVAQGQSILHEKDANSFNKEKGRKLALAKALNNLFPGKGQKEERELVWLTYHMRNLRLEDYIFVDGECAQ